MVVVLEPWESLSEFSKGFLIYIYYNKKQVEYLPQDWVLMKNIVHSYEKESGGECECAFVQYHTQITKKLVTRVMLHS